jgi:hypothetical protein
MSIKSRSTPRASPLLRMTVAFSVIARIAAMGGGR